MNSYILFCYLQLLDGLSTLCFLQHGDREMNPLVNFAMGHLGSVEGVIIAKLIGILIGTGWLLAYPKSSFKWFNVFYALVVAGNLLYIVK